MNIYISGAFDQRSVLRPYASLLFNQGHHVTSTWLTEQAKPAALTLDQWHKATALRDIADISSAECIILDLTGKSTTGGRYVEWGYAIGRGSMLKVLINPEGVTGVFDSLSDLVFPNWNECLTYLSKP